MSAPSGDWRDRLRFAASPRFELFHALELLFDPRARLHADWRAASRERLLLAPSGPLFAPPWDSSPLWVALGDALGPRALDAGFDALLAEFRALPPASFAREVLEGLLHEPRVFEPLLAGTRSLAAALRAASPKKREWLGHIGLYPFDSTSSLALGLEALARDPAGFRDAAALRLASFWEQVFARTWSDLAPAARRAAEAMERLALVSSLPELVREARLLVEVDESRQRLLALRGGHVLRLADIEALWLLPSAFNVHRFWGDYPPPAATAGARSGRARVACFPWFEPTLSPASSTAAEPALAPPSLPVDLDLALVFKALGDPTRFAIARLLGARTRTAAELADALSLSRPTLSHHVQVLRHAGLLEETPSGNAVRLELRRAVFASLSTLALDTLFAPDLESDPAPDPAPASGARKRP